MYLLFAASESVVSQIAVIIDKVAQKGAEETKVLHDKLDHMLSLEEECVKLQREMLELEKKCLEVHLHLLWQLGNYVH